MPDMPRGCNFHGDAAWFHLLKEIGRYFICSFIVCAVPACGHLCNRNDRPTEATSHSPLILKIYRGPLNHLAAVRRGDCPMYPSCSEFGAQAIATHGTMAGWVMTLDRLLRCGRDEMNLAPRVFAGGHLKAYDPVTNNDFWCVPSQKSAGP